ncbi:MAG: TraM recognition domain-containing protein [Deltaproteobacteria bacterium]|jgi:intracellular multiplication protein IcmO|nr:TraM recognition domain-containing protein [Deltaproteobacteria bacterium]
MRQPTVDGLRADERADPKKIHRDVRTPWERLLAVLAAREPVTWIIIGSSVMVWVYPELTLSMLLIQMVLSLAYLVKTRPAGLPLRLPRAAEKSDPGAPIPGRRGFARSAGIVYLGNETESGREMWLGEKDLLTHILVLGTTGSGKTQALVSMAFNALATGSGVFYIDPKSSSELPMQIWQLARFLGREDDFRVLNYVTTGPPVAGRLTNTNNPFSLGSADALTQLLGSLIPPSEGANSIFADKAMALISGLMYALVDLRDRGRLQLSVSTIRDYLAPKMCVRLLSHQDLGEAARASLKAALLNCNWVESKTLNEQHSFFEQYGYAQSYFGRALSSLTDTYGHIYGAEQGEVDFRDVVLNRRILVTLLPSMEKSPQELASLGKITLSAVRTAASVGLGAAVEGHEKDVLGSLPVHFQGTGPFMSIVDEYAAIVTPGFEMLLTQGRGLGLATVVASQDYAGLIEADRKGAQQIVANTTMKIFMKTDDPDRTFGLLRALTGEAPVFRTTGYGLEPGSVLGGDWRDNLGAAVHMRPRSEFSDVTSHIEGEAHCVFRGRLVRAQLFYANPRLKGAVARVHRLLQMDSPSSVV